MYILAETIDLLVYEVQHTSKFLFWDGNQNTDRICFIYLAWIPGSDDKGPSLNDKGPLASYKIHIIWRIETERVIPLESHSVFIETFSWIEKT